MGLRGPYFPGATVFMPIVYDVHVDFRQSYLGEEVSMSVFMVV